MAKRGAIVVVLAAAIAAFLWFVYPGWGDRDQKQSASPTADVTAAPAAKPTRDPAAAQAAPPRPAQPLRLAPAVLSTDDGAINGRFAGRVVNWGSGEGVAGAEIVFDSPSGAVTVATGDDGSFSFVPTEVGGYQLAVATADGYLPFAPEWGRSTIALTARPGKVVSGIVLYLTPAIEYTGVVVRAGGEPIAGAQIVMVSGARTFKAVPVADRFVSGKDGTFKFSAPDFAVLRATAKGYVTRYGVVDGDVAITRKMTIEMTAEGAAEAAELVTFRGIAVDADGSAVPSAVAVAEQTGEPNGVTMVARSGDDGRFAFNSVPAGRYMIAVSHPDYASATGGYGLGTAVGKLAEERFVLGPGASIGGRVTGPDGTAVPAFSVSVMVKSGIGQRVVATGSFLDGGGEFVVRGLSKGDYFVQAFAHGYAESEPIAAPAKVEPSTNVVLALRAGGSVSGVVRSTEPARVLPLARVSLEGGSGAAESAARFVASVVTDDDGKFSLSGLPPGRRSIVVAAANHNPKIMSGLDIVGGNNVGPLTIELSPVEAGAAPKTEFAGIGAVLAADGDALLIRDTVPNGGAAAAGMSGGDRIVAVDGNRVETIGFQKAIQGIRGIAGTTVRLTVLKKGADAPTDIDVTRKKLSVGG